MHAFLEEVKGAVAGLARAPAFTGLAAGVLGLGLAAVIFMYGVADTLMLKPPPYPNADRLYTIVTIDARPIAPLISVRCEARRASNVGPRSVSICKGPAVRTRSS